MPFPNSPFLQGVQGNKKQQKYYTGQRLPNTFQQPLRQLAPQPLPQKSQAQKQQSLLNTIVNLSWQLYLITVPLLPVRHKPNPAAVGNTVATWRHLFIPGIEKLPPEKQRIVALQEEFVLGKVADVVYILLEINGYRMSRYRSERASETLRQAAYVLTLPEVVSKMTSPGNPYLTDERFESATLSTRFHILAELLPIYVGVLSIAEAYWQIQKKQLQTENCKLVGGS